MGSGENVGLRTTKELQEGNLYPRKHFTDIAAVTGIIKFKTLK